MLDLLHAILVLAAPAAVATSSRGIRRSSGTLGNLQAAFDSESNAHLRYLAFAERADEEGYGEIASLFRATAAAESIHARNHAAVMEHMGVTPRRKLYSIEVRSTRKNLLATIESQKQERDVLYPEFLESAREESAESATRSFTSALEVEAVQAVLYQDALDNLDKRKGRCHTYYVCPDCGNTLGRLSIAKCLICGHPKGGFLTLR